MKRKTKRGLGFLVFLVLVVLLGPGLAFENEPEGFRGLKWGDRPGEDMQFVRSEDVLWHYYTLPEDKLSLGTASLDGIGYQFFTQPEEVMQRFSSVALYFKGKGNYDCLKMVCEAKFGEPTDEGFEVTSWEGSKATVFLKWDFIEKEGFLVMASVPLFLEYSQAKKKLESEKAEGDW